jgi:TetR/AcrR family transcriptional repressor of nem operon
MRKSREEAALTRQKIIAAAARLFRARGIDAVSVADIMGSLGLTVGGFYKHFESKDALVAEAIDVASVQSTSRTGSAEELLAGYLSMAHRNDRERGCPVAALCSEIAHQGRSTKKAFTVAVERLIERIVAMGLPRKQALAVGAQIVGALVLARATADEKLAREILNAAGSSIDLPSA